MGANVFAVQVFFIVFRECLEASIIISVLLSFLKQSLGEPHQDHALYKRLVRQVWYGSFSGILICLIIGGAFVGVFYGLGHNIWAKAEQLWEGIFYLIACIIVTAMGLALLRINKTKEQWRIKIAKTLVEKNKNSKKSKLFGDWARRYAMFLLPFITTLREGVEGVVFVAGVSLGYPATAFPLPVVTGIIAGLGCGYLIYRGGNAMSIQLFLIASTCILYLIAAGMFSKVVWDLQYYRFQLAVGADVSEQGSGPGSYNIKETVWHVNCCNAETDNGWDVFNAILGWENTGTYGSVIAYIVYWIFIMVTVGYMLWEERSGKRTLRERILMALAKVPGLKGYARRKLDVIQQNPDDIVRQVHSGMFNDGVVEQTVEMNSCACQSMSCSEHFDGCFPVTALKEIHLSSSRYLLKGQGPFVSVIDVESGESIHKLKIFKRNNVHGFMTDEQRCQEQDKITVLAWGGSSLRFIHILGQGEDPRVRIVCGTLEHAAPDWIYDICSALVDDGPNFAYLITGHNSVLSVSLKRVTDSKYPNAVQLRHLVNGVQSTLYSANIVALSSSHILIAAGTVFGEIIVWSCFKSDSTDGNATTFSSSIHHFFTGHDGSIFGVGISDELRFTIAGKEQQIRLLASCSDDRTVRIWDISDCTHATSADRAAYVTDGFDLRSTGFGITAPKRISTGSESAVAKGWGHSSRVWGVYFLPARGDHTRIVNLVSRGEDATSRLWRLDLTFSTSKDGVEYELRNISTLGHHAGKHIWSLALSKGDDDTQVVYTGGNDGAVRMYKLTYNGGNDVSPYIPKILLKAAYSKVEIDGLMPRVFGFVSKDSVAVVYTTGLVQLGTFTTFAPLSNKPQMRWETLSTEEDLRSFATISSLSSYGLAIIGGSSGRLRLYDQTTRQMTDLIKVPRRPLKIVMLDAVTNGVSGSPRNFRFLVGYPHSEEAHLFSVEIKGERYDVKQTNLILPPALRIYSGSIIGGGKCLAIGGKDGQLLLYTLDPTKGRLEYSFVKWRAHGRETVNFINSIDDDKNSDTEYFLTGGGDCHYCVYRLHRQSDAENAYGLQQIHRSSAPLSQIKGAYFDEKTGQFILYGFRDVSLILWNETTQTEIITLDCGGVNRVWQFMPDPSTQGAGTIVWNQARSLHAVVADTVVHHSLQLGSHGREQKTLAVTKAGIQNGDQTLPLIASGGEDTLIRISVPSRVSKGESSTWNAAQCLRILSGHVSGLQQIKWSDDGRFLFSSAGGEGFMAWRIRSAPKFGLAVLMEAAIPREETEVELRVTSFDVLRMKSSVDEDKFLLALVYSNSTVKVFSYTSSMDSHTYELLGKGTYSTNCLTEVHFMVQESRIFLVTGATDGYLAFWPVDWITHEGCYQFSVNTTFIVNTLKWELHHAIHASSIKALENGEVYPGYQVLVSGGDDNSLSITLVDLNGGVRVVSSVRIVNAHASAITAVKILSTRTDTTATLKIASSANDQRIKLWSVIIDLVKETSQEQVISVTLESDRYCPVADIAAMDDMEIADNATGTTEKLLVLGGVGMEMVRWSD
ncbi:WD repeat protein [Talaromyces stipitatus ATCC 10500]|uniref:WD repeat protein n=1 Tax=Talaromyces stipitatus (strain ATCC 10500 / CBS 375.48 / QM 6759 / NRRL 1006) TaxID=441959 RepID=B8MHQ5_TALSN|nr:WD repeat protein [Talaromyces stipitatus ATCC 10500]EED16385.1 WD repeat protein [Talaromyces stipitatus ATCC 10500]